MNRGREGGLSLGQQLGGYSISRASKIMEGKKRELVKVLKDMRRDLFLGVEFLCLVRLLSCATMANFAITAWFLELQNKMHFCFVFKVDWGKPSHCKVILFFPKQKETKENGFPGVSLRCLLTKTDLSLLGARVQFLRSWKIRGKNGKNHFLESLRREMSV